MFLYLQATGSRPPLSSSDCCPPNLILNVHLSPALSGQHAWELWGGPHVAWEIRGLITCRFSAQLLLLPVLSGTALRGPDCWGTAEKNEHSVNISKNCANVQNVYVPNTLYFCQGKPILIVLHSVVLMYVLNWPIYIMNILAVATNSSKKKS